MLLFLLAVFTPLVPLVAGFLLGVIWLRDEHARLTALREGITQESATLQRLASCVLGGRRVACVAGASGRAGPVRDPG
jgi:hypothetical protein